jgi:hypothetical protein
MWCVCVLMTDKWINPSIKCFAYMVACFDGDRKNRSTIERTTCDERLIATTEPRMDSSRKEIDLLLLSTRRLEDDTYGLI